MFVYPAKLLFVLLLCQIFFSVVETRPYGLTLRLIWGQWGWREQKRGGGKSTDQNSTLTFLYFPNFIFRKGETACRCSEEPLLQRIVLKKLQGMKSRGPDPESKKPPFIPHLGNCDTLQSPGWCCDLLTTGRTSHSQTKKAGLTSHSTGGCPIQRY